MKKKLLITGASSGLGNYIANELSNEYDVIGLARTASKSKGDFIKFDVDLTNEAQVKSVIKTIHDEIGEIDVLINNAGAGVISELIDSTLDQWNDMFSTNVTTAYLVTREIVRLKSKDKFLHIINISSEAGKEGFATYSAYCAAKFALTGFSQSIAHELKSQNVKVDVVYPGDILTPFMDKCPIDLDLMKKYDVEVLDKEKMLTVNNVTSSIKFLLNLPKNVYISSGITLVPYDL